MKKEKTNKKLKFLSLSLTKTFVLTALILAIGQIILSNRLATSGGELQKINKQIEMIEAENKRLQNEIAQKISLSEISVKAKKRGFVREPKVINLSGDSQVALKQSNNF